jgi:hypothetical protein
MRSMGRVKVGVRYKPKTRTRAKAMTKKQRRGTPTRRVTAKSEIVRVGQKTRTMTKKQRGGTPTRRVPVTVIPDVPLTEILSYLSDSDIASLARTAKDSTARTARTLRARKQAYMAGHWSTPDAIVETSAIPDFASLQLNEEDMAQIIDEPLNEGLEYLATPQDLMALQARGGDYNEFVRGLTAWHQGYDTRSLPVINVRFGTAYRSARRQRRLGTPVVEVLASMHRGHGMGEPCSAASLVGMPYPPNTTYLDAMNLVARGCTAGQQVWPRPLWALYRTIELYGTTNLDLQTAVLDDLGWPGDGAPLSFTDFDALYMALEAAPGDTLITMGDGI